MGDIFSKLFTPRPDAIKVGPEINRGSYGVVFRGTLGATPVAIKMIHQLLVDYARTTRENPATVMTDFGRECELMEAAQHAHVVQFLGVFNLDGNAVLVMELMEETLDQFLRNNRGTLTEKKQVAICLQIASGLMFLHQHNPQILHRDLTAKNILLSDSGKVVKISDLGQAKFRPSDVQYLTTKAPGCVPYMPPECLADRPRFTDKSDIFSFGVVILYVATQQPPSCGLVNIGAIPEVDRREGDLAKLPDAHPLKPTVLKCLKDDAAERPNCDQVNLSLLMDPRLNNPGNFQSGPLLHGEASLHSVKLPDLPFPTTAATVIKINENIYVCGGWCSDVVLDRQVQVYSVNHHTWSTLDLSPQYRSQAASINGQIVLIGEREASSGTITNLISTWTGQGWQHDIPPMPTKRARPGVTTHQTHVVVAGGVAEDEQTILSSIDILNITTLQWLTPDNLTLPRPMAGMQVTISNAHLHVASAAIEYVAATRTSTATKTVWQLPVTALENALTTEGDRTSHLWAEIAPPPYYWSALLQDTAHVVAVGGVDNSFVTSSDVFVYNRDSNKWCKVGQLGVPRAGCAVVSLSRTSLIVCGGLADSRDLNTRLTSVEVLHV